MKAIWNNIRGLDLLQSLPYSEPTALAIGHSLGDTTRFIPLSSNERIHVVVSAGGFDRSAIT